MKDAQIIDVTRWYRERANPDYGEDSVEHILDTSRDGEFVEWLPGIDTDPDDKWDNPLARFRVEGVTHEGETVNYSIEISASLIQQAVEEHPEL